MQYYLDLDSYKGNLNTAVTIGKFEGFHRGHQKLLKALQKRARAEKLISLVLAFDMGQKSLLTNEERREYLENKVDCLIQCPFTFGIKNMEAEAFIDEVLVKRLRASDIIVGSDFRFGHGLKGSVAMLEKYRPVYHYKLSVIEKETYRGREISSTFVREALKDGAVELAATLLGYPYQMTGEVGHGKMLARRLGFPTVNIVPDPRKLMPRFGVYACRVKIDDRWYFGIGNVGVRPTVTDNQEPLVEIFLFGFCGAVYGKKVTVEFCAFERPEIKLCSLEELKKQVDTDIAFGIRYFRLQE